jgi:ABC-type transport system substrate-binding protein
MAPEQWRSAKDADARSDIWSLGVVLHELLSGSRPFAGDNVTEMCAAVLAEDPAKLELDHQALVKVVERCLAKEPEDRYQRIPELARDLANCATDREAANALVDRMDRVAGRSSSPSLPRPATAPTAVDRLKADATAPAPAALPAVATTQRRVPRRTVALAVGVAAVLAGAGTYAVTRSSGTSSTVAAPTVPQSGGTLRVAMSRPDETHVALYAGQPTRTQAALRMVMERLIVLDDAKQLQKSKSVLDGVESQDGGKLLVLTLRPNVKFHGTPCMESAAATATDLRFSIEEAIAHHQLDFDIEHMEANGLELKITMKTPALAVAHALSHVWLVPAKLAECEPDRKQLRHPVGSGPFRYVESPVASTLTLARWNDYWRTDSRGTRLPYLDRIELVHVSEANVALAALRAEVRSPTALHVFIPAEPLKTKLVDHSTGKLVGEGTGGLELGLRTNQGDAGLWLFEVTPKPGPLRDSASLRRAVALGIDRDAAVAVAHKGAASPVAAYGRFLQSQALGYRRATTELRMDPKAAQQLVGSVKDISELVIGYSHDEVAARVVKKSLEAIGLRIKLEKIEMRDQSNVLARGDGVDAMLISRWGKMLGDELISIGAYDQHRVTKTHALLAELAGKSQRADREAIYKQIEDTLLAELPSIPIAKLDPKRITFVTIVRNEVEGFHDRETGFVPHDDSLTFAETWLRTDAP